MRTLNDDEAKYLGRRRAHDGRVSAGSHRAAELSTERVRGHIDWSSCRRVIVRQPHHKVVQTKRYVPVQTEYFQSIVEPTQHAVDKVEVKQQLESLSGRMGPHRDIESTSVSSIKGN